MQVDRDSFFNNYRSIFGGLCQGQVDGLNTLLTFMEKDQDITDLRHFAYMLATTKRETGSTYRPIEEFGKGKGRPYGVPNAHGLVFFGRGYVQLTWEKNYRVYGIDDTPEKALDPEMAYHIMTTGMRTGAFTGKKLTDFIEGVKCDYLNARRIINGMDHATEIALCAVGFEKILSVSAREGRP